VRHQQRATAKVWRAQKKGEVQAAVKTAKDDLKTKATELVTVQKILAQEQKAHSKAVKELNALKTVHAKMKRKSVSAASELETLRSVKRQKTGGGTGAGPGAAGPGERLGAAAAAQRADWLPVAAPTTRWLRRTWFLRLYSWTVPRERCPCWQGADALHQFQLAI